MNNLLVVLCALSITACANDPETAGKCGTEQLQMSGAFSANTPSAAVVTVNNVVIGVGGLGLGATTSYALSLRDPLHGELATTGVHDVATANLEYLSSPASANCQTAGECDGFVATTGMFEVEAVSPYRASFTLGDLHAYDGSSSTLGAAIAGEVTGCVAAAP
jgi:hypothetical protein